MLFKQLSVFRLPDDFDLSAAELEAALADRPLEPCGAYDMQRSGWIAAGPATGPGAEHAARVHSVNAQHLIVLGIEEKLLPASIVRDVAAERAAAIEAEQGHPPGRRQLRELKEAVADELRARALVRRRRIRAWLDPVRRRLVLDNASPNRCEQFLSVLRDTLVRFDTAPLSTRQAPSTSMANWLTAGSAPPAFNIDEDLELRATADTKHIVRYTHHPLDDDEVRGHLKAGLAPTRLGLTWRDRVSFVLADTLQLRRIQFVGVGADEGDDVPEEERFDADFALMSGELSKLIDELTDTLGGAEGGGE